MNEKARVSKELNAKHIKILEGLLKLPENRECADCKSRGPRWASVNLGIFICLQCSGAHRSLGVHISQVRSATLDTWLPEQVAFIQTMGNQKSNSYWEAELPPKYDRVGIEYFIRSKYMEKKWIPRSGNAKSLTGVGGEQNLASKPQERISSQLPESDRTTLASRNVVRQPPSELPKQASPVHKPEVVQNAKQVVSAEDAKGKTNVSPDSQKKIHQNVERSISQAAKAMPEAKENGSVPKTHSAVVPQPVEAQTVVQQNTNSTAIENKSKFDAGIEELIKDFQWNSQPVLVNPLQNVKNEQQTSVGPQQALLMPVTMTHFGGPQNVYQAANGSNQLFSQNWGSIGSHVPGAKQMGSTQYLHASMSSTYPLHPSMFSAIGGVPINGITATGANRAMSSFPAVPVVPMQSGYQYDFSSLTHEMLSRR